MTGRSNVNWEKERPLGIITVNNPPVNTLSPIVKQELYACLEEIDADSDVKVVILTGAGDKIFMGGADIKTFPNRLKGNSSLSERAAQEGHLVLNRIADFSRPVIAALNGHTLGGGLEVALSCDMRVASPNIRIGVPEITLGVMPGMGGTQHLPRLIGYAKAMEMLLTGEPVRSEEALRIGLVNAVAPGKAETLACAKELGSKIARHSSEAIYLIKKVVRKGLDMKLPDAIALETEYFGRIFKTSGAREGIMAFLEKRKPNFDDL